MGHVHAGLSNGQLSVHTGCLTLDTSYEIIYYMVHYEERVTGS